MSDISERTAAGGETSLADRIDARARAVRGVADLTARQVCAEDPPSWGDVIGWLDGWSADMSAWAAEVRRLAAAAGL